MATTWTLNANNYTDSGYVRITWANQASPNHYSYRVYRFDPGETLFTLIAERTDTPANFTVDDYNAPVGTVVYSVVEVTTNNSVQTEETKTTKTTTLTSPYYWLVHPTTNSKTMQLRNVNDDSFKTEREVAIKNLMGRGRKVDVGDNYGRTGSLSGTIYNTPTKTAREFRLALEAMKDEDTFYYMRTPFGDYWKIWFDDPEFGRIAGVGTSEFVTFSFTYYEVA